MAENGKFILMKITDIIVSNRVREDFGDVENLALDIRVKGLLHPIVVDDNGNLLAGERRLRACKLLGFDEIKVHQLKDLNEMDKKEIELSENIKRKDLTWQEEIKATEQLDAIQRQKYGEAVKGHEGRGWGIAQTAQSLQESVGTTSQDIKLARAIKEYPELANEKNKSSAMKKYQMIIEGKIKKEIASRIKIDVGDRCLINGRCEVEIKKLKDESVDLIFTDPPWGIDIGVKSQMGKTWGEKHESNFEDGKYATMELLSKVFKEYFRVLKNDRHAYFFFGCQFYKEIKTMLEEAGFNVNPIPLIWNKISGGQAATAYNFPNAYETIFFCMKGQRSLQTTIPNLITCDRVPANSKIHPTEKPRKLIRTLIEASSDEGELVLDGFVGSASTLLAAFECNRNALGFELDEKFYNTALLAIQEFKKGMEE